MTAVIIALVGTLVLVDDAIDGTLAPIEPGTTLEVGRGVTFVPADGWQLDEADSSADALTALVASGGSFTVQVGEWQEDLAAEVARTRARIEADGSVRVSPDEASFHTAGGLTGVRLAYVATNLQGRAWIVVDDDRDLSIVVYAPSLTEAYQQLAPQSDAMVDSIRSNGDGA